jgi:predicted nuclease of predicted toxin-antitoxin system
VRFLADENLDNDIVRAILRQSSTFDVVRVQDVGLTGANDPTVLAWAAAERRVLVTHDVNTIPRYAYERVSRGENMPGVIIVPQRAPITRCIEDLLLLAECGEDRECEGRVLFLPL